MSSPSRTARKNRKLKTLLLSLLVLVSATFLIVGPKLFGQTGAKPSTAVTAPAAHPKVLPTPTAAEPSKPPSRQAEAEGLNPTRTAKPNTGTKASAGNAEAIQLPFGEAAWGPLYTVLAAAFLALMFGLIWWRKTAKHDPGSERMQGVASAVREGALAYLSRQVKTMIPLVIVIGIGLFFLYKNEYGFMDAEKLMAPLGMAMSTWLGVGVAVAFLLGVTASYLAGYVGMGVAVQGNVRVANAALRSFKQALEIAFQAGAVSGMFTVGLGLLGATLTFMIFKENAMFVLVGFGFGGSLAALFMRVGGGIFTKAADVGADLVGKVEAGIPEDDPRNAATIADNVGDNVGDCAGMAADVFESYEVTLVAAIILAAAVGKVLSSAGLLIVDTNAFTLNLVIYALLVRAVGVVASIIGVLAVRGKDDPKMDPMKPINIGFYASSIVALAGFFVVAKYVFHTTDFTTFVLNATQSTPINSLPIAQANLLTALKAIGPNFWWMAALATTFGIVLTQVIGFLTEYFTSAEKKPVTEIATSAKTGPATLILAGLSEGLESSVWGIIAIAVTIYAAYILFGANPSLAAFSAYAIALTGLGLLATTGYVLAMDTYGPISDNANGIFEMSGALKNEDGSENKAAHNIVSRLDMVGNTTKALTKGFAIATAVIAAVALYRSFIDASNLTSIQVNLPQVFIGLLIGGAIPFLFSSFAIRAVSRAAVQLVEEVRRQFRTIPGIWEYTGVGEKGKPDYARCVAISTAAAQKELLGPGLLAVFSPILVGFWLGPEALGGFLAGAILAGQLMAVFMSNTGGAWDNAKKKIEDGFLGGKGSDAHKAGVIGDTVGDPLKDTAGPALNPMIKVMNLVSILVAPAAVALQNPNDPMKWVVVAVALVILIIAISFSKRGGIESAAGDEGAVVAKPE